MTRLAWGLAALTLVLIVSGGLVTAFGAGMAIPDWPTSFGSWLPISEPWAWRRSDAWLNQGHRAVSQAALVWAIGLAVALWRWEARRPVRRLGLAVVSLSILEGALGGWRVLGGSVLAAQVHAAMAPVLLALCVALATVTTARWLTEEPARPHRHTKALRRWCLFALAVAFLFTVAGVQLRHVPLQAGLNWLPFWTWCAALLALMGIVAGGALLTVAWRHFRDCPMLLRRSGCFVGILAAQLLVAGGQWVASYGWPPWFSDYLFPISYTVVAQGPLLVVLTTSQIALGSLTPAVGVHLSLWAHRLVREARP